MPSQDDDRKQQNKFRNTSWLENYSLENSWIAAIWTHLVPAGGKAGPSGRRSEARTLLLPLTLRVAVIMIEIAWKLLKLLIRITAWLARYHVLLAARARECVARVGGAPLVAAVERAAVSVANHPLVVALLSWLFGIVLWLLKLGVAYCAGLPIPAHIESEAAQKFDTIADTVPDPYHNQLRETRAELSKMLLHSSSSRSSDYSPVERRSTPASS